MTQNFGRSFYKSSAELLIDFTSAGKFNEAPQKKTFRGNINRRKQIHYFRIISHISSFRLILQSSDFVNDFFRLKDSFWNNIQRTFLGGM